MKGIRQKLINKIKSDCDCCGLEDELTTDLKLYRNTSSRHRRSTGVMLWYWMVAGRLIGSTEKMTRLLKYNKLYVLKLYSGDYEITGI
ncbi:MAG: hypothetical protein M0R17_07355 [Candidatus Omnitrophica bacterium]|jgi:hypothetical protein|nr:hypothetical protein [Candidatus Omnitrophota bacterium]